MTMIAVDRIITGMSVDKRTAEPKYKKWLIHNFKKNLNKIKKENWNSIFIHKTNLHPITLIYKYQIEINFQLNSRANVNYF